MAIFKKAMSPQTSRQLATMIAGAGVCVAYSWLDPEGWKPIERVLSYSWLIVPGWIAFAIIDIHLMDWFGKRDERGRPETYIDPGARRIEEIEAAINRLHEYVQELDPQLAEEIRLERDFMSGEGGMFAGMDHNQYVRDREKRGLRTRYGRSIWRDPDPTGPGGDAPGG